jgi:hypothetical protein
MLIITFVDGAMTAHIYRALRRLLKFALIIAYSRR